MNAPRRKRQTLSHVEQAEEAGVTSAHLVRRLGESWFVAAAGTAPAGLEEQVHHAFHLRLADVRHDAPWDWNDREGGAVVRHRFVFRWIDLDTASTTLHPMQGMWIAGRRSSPERLATIDEGSTEDR